MAFFRRRMPYTIGADLLPEEKDGLKERLTPEEDERLTADILEVYDRLLPSAESDDRRRQLVNKLEKLFNDQWPGNNIKVNVFGSSGNKLCSSDSDGGSQKSTGGLKKREKNKLTVCSGHLHHDHLEGPRTCVRVGGCSRQT